MQNKIRLLILSGVYLILLLIVSVHLTLYFVDKAAIVSFKKLYSAYSQALLLTVDDMSGDTGCYFSSDKNIPSKIDGCDRFYKNFATNLKVTKYCKDNALKKGCLPVYKKYAQTPTCAGFSENMMNKYDQVFVMNDETNLTVFNQPAKQQKPLFAVDSNGSVFPNKAGYDLFSLVIMKSPNGNYYFHPNVTYCLPVEKKVFIVCKMFTSKLFLISSKIILPCVEFYATIKLVNVFFTLNKVFSKGDEYGNKGIFY